MRGGPVGAVSEGFACIASNGASVFGWVEGWFGAVSIMVRRFGGSFGVLFIAFGDVCHELMRVAEVPLRE